MFFLTTSLYSQNYWIRSNFNAGYTLNKVVYTDSTTFFVAADSGKILYSSNAGSTWIVRNTGIVSNIYEIGFANANTGYAVAWEFGLNIPDFIGSITFKTTNGGTNWIEISRKPEVFISKITFADSQHGFMAEHPTGIFRTSNGGLNWSLDHIDSTTFYDFPVRNFGIGDGYTIACGGWIDIQGVIWRTSNNGLNWTTKGVSPEPLYGFHFFDNNHVIAVGGDFEYGASMASSTDGGINWSYITFKQFGTALALDFRTPTEGWMVLGIGQKFLYTMNRGQDWISFTTPNGESIYDIKFANQRNGIAVGERGAILKFNTAYVNIQNNSSQLPNNISLKQNYPNPFNPETIISFTLERPDIVSLKVYDLLGKEVATLISGVTKSGEHKINFNATDIPAGIYYYTLKINNRFTETKKMVLVK